MDMAAAAGAPFSALREYAALMRRIITGPREFFRRSADTGNTAMMPVFALGVSGVLYAGASLLTYTCPQPIAALGIFFLNATGTPLLAAGIGFAIARIVFSLQLSFAYVFRIYAYASAVALLLAWTPYLLILAEFWRWWLISVGLINACGLKRWQALLVIGVTIGCMISG
ncbi:MAG: YIP1 family protein, partial [Desulfobacteraceae bacterium]|nr:YIP1 family protein [Desulfobacteraceae bacterium]